MTSTEPGAVAARAPVAASATVAPRRIGAGAVAVAGPVPAAAPTDSFVFRRVASGVYAHVGGVGRGEGWAGIVELELDREPALADAIAGRRPATHVHDVPRRVFGPYWSTEAVVVPLRRDEVVVLAGRDVAGASHEDWERWARETSSRVEEVGPAKRLADELELLHAVKAVALTPPADLRTVADQIVRAAATALSCEVGVLHLPRTGVTGVVDDGAPIPVTSCEARDWAVAEAVRAVAPARCLQDPTADDRAGWPAWTTQVVSALALPVAVEPGAMLLLAHTTAAPRGFTDLCQQIAHDVAEAARTVLMAAAQHEQLREEAARARTAARTDDLTGVLNRRGWAEAVAAVSSREDAPVAVLVADGNGLKEVNDREGHDVGDRHLEAWAGALRAAVRGEDVVARTGGDEFAVLVPGADEARCRRIVEDVRACLGAGPLTTSLALGWATGRTAELRSLLATADRAMYLDKQRARRGR